MTKILFATEILFKSIATKEEFLDFQKSIFAILPDSLVDVFVLKYSLNYKNKEIAEILNISCGNVRQRVFRLNNILKKALLEQKCKGRVGQAEAENLKSDKAHAPHRLTFND